MDSAKFKEQMLSTLISFVYSFLFLEKKKKDGCLTWHHIECQGMNVQTHQIMSEIKDANKFVVVVEAFTKGRLKHMRTF